MSRFWSLSDYPGSVSYVKPEMHFFECCGKVMTASDYIAHSKKDCLIHIQLKNEQAIDRAYELNRMGL